MWDRDRRWRVSGWEMEVGVKVRTRIGVLVVGQEDEGGRFSCTHVCHEFTPRWSKTLSYLMIDPDKADGRSKLKVRHVTSCHAMSCDGKTARVMSCQLVT